MKSDALKTIRCVSNSTTDWYTQRLAITDIGQNKAAFEAFQDQLESQLKAYFKKPDATGFVGLKREKMLAIKKFEHGGGMDYFTAFSKLDEYLDDKFFEMAELDKVDELRFRSLMIRLIVDCRK